MNGEACKSAATLHRAWPAANQCDEVVSQRHKNHNRMPLDLCEIVGRSQDSDYRTALVSSLAGETFNIPVNSPVTATALNTAFHL